MVDVSRTRVLVNVMYKPRGGGGELWLYITSGPGEDRFPYISLSFTTTSHHVQRSIYFARLLDYQANPQARPREGHFSVKMSLCLLG